MNKKLLSVILLLPVLLLGLLFTANYIAIGNLIDDPSRISFANPVEFVQIGHTSTIPCFTTPSEDKWQEDIVYEVDDPELVEIEGHALAGIKEGATILTASYKNGTLIDKIPVYVVDEDSSGLYALDLGSSLSGISDDRLYGRYDLSEGLELVDAKIEISVFDFSSAIYEGESLIPSKQAQEAKVTGGLASIAYNPVTSRYEVTAQGNEDIVLTFLNSLGEETELTIPLIEEGINVRSYRDLAYLTNHYEKDNPLCLQTSLESYDQCFDSEGNPLRNLKPLALTEGEKNQLQAFGDDAFYLARSFDGVPYYCEYAKTQSTYDTRFLQKLGQSADLIEGLKIHQDIYGNGHSLNFHDLTFPSGEKTNVNGQEIVALSEKDVYRGPLSFCGVSLTGDSPQVTVNGEDNIVMGIHSDGLTIDNLTVYGANNRPYVTDYEYGGTLLSRKGVNGFTIRNSLLQNARNGIRCFSSQDVVVDNCLLRNCRDYLLRLGSDVYKEQDHQATPSENYPEGERIDTDITVSDTYFANSGFFSIGVEAHFDGRFLYPTTIAGFETEQLFMGTLPLGGTSKGVNLAIEGDTRFYDWKLISAVSSSAFLQINDDLSGFEDLLEMMERFDLIPIIVRELSKEGNASFLIEEKERVDGQINPGSTFVNTGIAYYGGGLINSRADFAPEDLGLSPLTVGLDASLTTDMLLEGCIGPSPFRFYLYKNDSSIQPGDNPSLKILSERA